MSSLVKTSSLVGTIENINTHRNTHEAKLSGEGTDVGDIGKDYTRG